jgi:hypothetical protein
MTYDKLMRCDAGNTGLERTLPTVIVRPRKSEVGPIGVDFTSYLSQRTAAIFLVYGRE